MVELSPIRKQAFQKVYECVRGAGAAGMSIKQVGECAGFRGASPYITEMLDQLVATNWLRKDQVILQTGRGARMGWRYYVVDVNAELKF